MQEFVFRKEELLNLINNSPDSKMIAVRIDYEALGTKENEFRATVEASAVPPDGQQQEATRTPSAMTVQGCPNPPGCTSEPTP